MTRRTGRRSPSVSKLQSEVFEIRNLDGRDGRTWGARHGTSKVRNGRLKGETDTDYLMFACPDCDTPLKGPFTAGLEGFSWVKEGQVIALSLRIACPRCGFR